MAEIRVIVYDYPRPYLVKISSLYYNQRGDYKEGLHYVSGVGNADGATTANATSSFTVLTVPGSANTWVIAYDAPQASPVIASRLYYQLGAPSIVAGTSASGVGNADGVATANATSAATSKQVGNADGATTANATSSFTGAIDTRLDYRFTAYYIPAPASGPLSALYYHAAAQDVRVPSPNGVGNADGVTTVNAVSSFTNTNPAAADSWVIAYNQPQASPVIVSALYYHNTNLVVSAAVFSSGVGNADGVTTANATSSATSRQVANADGATTANATSSATSRQVANADGVTTANATGASAGNTSGNGNADGVATANATSAVVIGQTANADGVATANAIGASGWAQVGNADGVTTVNAVGHSKQPAILSVVCIPAFQANAFQNNAFQTCGGRVVGWPDTLRRRVPRKHLERLLKLQKDKVFGRKWFEEFEAESRKFARTEAEAARAEAALEARKAVEAVEAAQAAESYAWEQHRLAVTLQVAQESKRSRDINEATRLAVAQARAIQAYVKAYEEYQNENEEEEILMLIA